MYRQRLQGDCPLLVELREWIESEEEKSIQLLKPQMRSVGVALLGGAEPRENTFSFASFCPRVNCGASRVVAKIINLARWGAFQWLFLTSFEK